MALSNKIIPREIIQAVQITRVECVSTPAINLFDKELILTGVAFIVAMCNLLHVLLTSLVCLDLLAQQAATWL